MRLFATLLLGLTLFQFFGAVMSQTKEKVSTFTSYWAVGDPKRCLEKARQSEIEVLQFGVLPGVGWDNLRNVEQSQVIDIKYDECKTTNDGKYLIPDSVFTVPLKSSQVETFADLMSNWHNTSSVTSRTINSQGGADLGFFSINGKFSYEHQKIKSTQIEDKAVTTRIQLRYTRYEAKLQHDSPLHPNFKSRLLDIAGHLELNQTEEARYKAQLVVRDYGTHVLTSVTAGAAVVKEDYLKRKFVETHSQEKSKILASASAKFGFFGSSSLSYNTATDRDINTEYTKSLTHSYIESYGGPLLLAKNNDLNQWVDAVKENLVPIDRAGDPIYFFVTTQMLPELPFDLVDEVEEEIRSAVEIYYEMNVIPGCTKLGAPNFSFSANFDDGNCNAPVIKSNFGGIYQSCSVSGTVVHNSPCTGLDQVNPKTGDHSCQAGYTAVKIHQASKKGKTEKKRSCKRCWLVATCCKDKYYTATAHYETFWCAATGRVSKNSGYLFGGVYTDTTDNLVTGEKDCPPGFYPRTMLADMHVCISDDYELDAAHSVPFGGFFSCSHGNPLVKTLGGSSSSLRTSDDRTKQCPKGFSQHLVSDDNGCAIHYCIEMGALSGPSLPPVKRPPFISKPSMSVEVAEKLVLYDQETQTWMEDDKARQFLAQVEDGSSKSAPLRQNNAPGMSAFSPSLAVCVLTLALLQY